MKKLRYLVIVILLLVGVKNIYAYTFDNTIKVYDYAQILTEKQENKLIENVKKYIDKYNMDMVIVTVKYYTYDNLSDYINEFYNRNNFGLGANKSGIIFALDVKNNDIDIKTFGTAKTLYSEAEIKNIISSLNKKDKYYNKLSNFIKYSNEYINEDNTFIYEDNILKSINWLIIVLPSIFIPTLIVIIILLKIRKGMKGNNEYYYIGNNLIMKKREDKFITTHTKQFNKVDKVRN